MYFYHVHEVHNMVKLERKDLIQGKWPSSLHTALNSSSNLVQTCSAKCKDMQIERHECK